MRLLRGRRAGGRPAGPSLLARGLALLVAVSLVLLMAPAVSRPLLGTIRWVTAVLW